MFCFFPGFCCPWLTAYFVIYSLIPLRKTTKCFLGLCYSFHHYPLLHSFYTWSLIEDTIKCCLGFSFSFLCYPPLHIFTTCPSLKTGTCLPSLVLFTTHLPLHFTITPSLNTIVRFSILMLFTTHHFILHSPCH